MRTLKRLQIMTIIERLSLAVNSKRKRNPAVNHNKTPYHHDKVKNTQNGNKELITLRIGIINHLLNHSFLLIN